MKEKTIATIISLALITLFLASGCVQEPSGGEETIKIGALLPLTGETMVWGENTKNGMELAVEEINGAGGINGRQIDDKAATLSGGQQRLLEFGRVMIRDDELILLDEPFAGVSAGNSKKIEDVIRLLQKENKTIILIEHDAARIKRLCSHLLELDKGKIVRHKKMG